MRIVRRSNNGILCSVQLRPMSHPQFCRATLSCGKIASANGMSYNFLTIAQLHFYIFTARRYASAVYVAIVCLSVRPSVTRRYCTKTAIPRITQTTPYYSPGTLVFLRQRSRRNSTESPQRKHQIEVG